MKSLKKEKTKVLLSLPTELLTQVDERAQRLRRPRSAEVVVLLERSLARPAAKKAARGARA